MAQLTCQNLCVGYDGKSVLQDLNFEVFAGDYLYIVGENGSGKSTSAAADRRTKGLPGIRERNRSLRVSGTLRQPLLL